MRAGGLPNRQWSSAGCSEAKTGFTRGGEWRGRSGAGLPGAPMGSAAGEKADSNGPFRLLGWRHGDPSYFKAAGPRTFSAPAAGARGDPVRLLRPAVKIADSRQLIPVSVMQ